MSGAAVIMTTLVIWLAGLASNPAPGDEEAQVEERLRSLGYL